MPNAPLRILVTDGDTRAALAVTRSLGRQGHTVIVGEKHGPALAQTSRYCAQPLVYPPPEREERAFIDAIAQAVTTHRVDVLMPVADISTLLLTAERARLAPCELPFADAAIVERAADKAALMRSAQRLGVPIPTSWFLERPEDVAGLSPSFPLVLKPHRSRVRTAAGWRSCSVSYANDAAALARELAHRDAAEYPIILQERISGPGAGIFVCYDRGRPIALCSHRRLREKPPWGGVSVLSETVPIDPRASEYAQRILGDLDWHGVAMVEFKVDARDGIPKLMEVNGRFWGSLQLAIDAGVDFPAILLGTLTGTAPSEPPPYRVGVRNRWFWGDVDALLVRLTARRALLPRRSRVRDVLEFLRLWGSDLYYENPKRDDLGPWWHETRKWIWRTP